MLEAMLSIRRTWQLQVLRICGKHWTMNFVRCVKNLRKRVASISSNTKVLAIKSVASAFNGVLKILIVEKIPSECQSSSICNN